LEAWRKVQTVNVESMLLGTQATRALLRTSGKTRKGGASNVNFSSLGGMRGAAFTSAYCASKGAVKLFSKSAAIEFGAMKYNIRVNSVHPGGIHTDMMRSIMQRHVDLGGVPSLAAASCICARPPRVS
jgi:NAD(P)-dependent dehydrogenase (short-subunit alcohol dehydrogenase family)